MARHGGARLRAWVGGALLLLAGCPESHLVAPREWKPGTRVTFRGLQSDDQLLVQGLFDGERGVEVQVGRTSDGVVRLVPPIVDERLFLDAQCTTEGTTFEGPYLSRRVSRATSCELPGGLEQVTVFATGEPRSGAAFELAADGGCTSLPGSTVARRVLPGPIAESQWLAVELERLDFPGELATWWATTADGTRFAAKLSWRSHSTWVGVERADGRVRLYGADGVVAGSQFANSTCTEVVATATAGCRPVWVTAPGLIDCAPRPHAVLVADEVSIGWSRASGVCAPANLAGLRAYRVVEGSGDDLPTLPTVERQHRRLVVHWLEVPDAGSTSLMADSLFDTQLGQPCRPRTTVDGALLCVPDEVAVVSHFADSLCRSAVASTAATVCRPPSHALVLSSAGLAKARRVLGQHTKEVFVDNGAGCTSVPVDPALSYWALEGAVPPEEVFARVTEVR